MTFYRSDSQVVADVSRFVADGFALGERAVVVATARHREAIDAELGRRGYRAGPASTAGDYEMFDAAETLDTFMVGDGPGGPDAARFETVLGEILDSAAAGGRPVRVFGEMVALLWDEGNVAGALALESLWNGLAATRSFTLLCAYPTAAFDSTSLHDASEVCHLHSRVRTLTAHEPGVPESAALTGSAHTSGVLMPVPDAVPAARLFVVSALATSVAPQTVDDVALVATELAANAVTHAASAFRVSLSCNASHIRIAVEDAAAAYPRPRSAGPNDTSGRGLALVQVLAERWGCDPLPTGKTVWAELALDPNETGLLRT